MNPTDRFVHHGVLYDDHVELLDRTLPVVLRALGEGHRVVVAGERAYSRAVGETLHDHPAGSVLVTGPESVPEEAAAFVTWLEQMLPPTGRLIVLVRHRGRRHPVPESVLAEALATLPVTLVCLCPHDAELPVLRRFHRSHAPLDATTPFPTPMPSPSPSMEPRTGAVRSAVIETDDALVRTTFTSLHDLSALRTHVATAAAVLGVGATAQDRAVLAVHEASVVACRLADLSGVDRPCELVAAMARSALVVDIRLPVTVGFPGSMLDLDPLVWARAFSDATSWSGSSRTRGLRVVVGTDQ